MPKTLLLADDSVTIQKVVGITFANEDVELVTVDNGDDALTRARQVKPDLVLADIGMPGLNGYELCAAIRRDPNLSHIPVLLLTGTFETYDESRARDVGASGHIAKPFEAQALVDRVFQLLAQAPPKPVAAPAKPPAPATKPAAPAQAAAPAPPQSPAPRPAPAAPRPAAAPPAAPPSGTRARPELPPVPHAPPTPVPRPAAPAAAPPKPAPQQAPAIPRPAPKRESTPFEFELPPAAAAKPAAPPAPADQEPIWEAEPEPEILADTALEPEAVALHEPVSDEPAAPEATRLFAPDLLGRPTQLHAEPPAVPDPPRAPARRADFSFDDLDFEEPTNPPSTESQIFGESSDGSHDFEPEFAQPVTPAPAEVEALADPLYSQTTFLDPARNERSAEAPALPDLLPTPQPRPLEAFSDDSQEELELEEADTAPEDDGPEHVDPLAEPFSPDTAAALDEPHFEPVAEPPRPASFAQSMGRVPTRSTVRTEEPETPVPTRLNLPSPATTAPRVGPLLAEADTLPPPMRRAPAPASRSAGVVDSQVLAQSVEKVAWEAFGALSEQVVGEVLKRVEAVVWEVVPQLCERLIREEIARLKAEMSE
ncbi:MAG TPA: response regulator [Myxococcota bacterium]|nr:response regulator [Myxococcota bacterium]